VLSGTEGYGEQQSDASLPGKQQVEKGWLITFSEDALLVFAGRSIFFVSISLMFFHSKDE